MAGFSFREAASITRLARNFISKANFLNGIFILSGLQHPILIERKLDGCLHTTKCRQEVDGMVRWNKFVRRGKR